MHRVPKNVFDGSIHLTCIFFLTFFMYNCRVLLAGVLTDVTNLNRPVYLKRITRKWCLSSLVSLSSPLSCFNSCTLLSILDRERTSMNLLVLNSFLPNQTQITKKWLPYIKCSPRKDLSTESS
jgi:hypothetical protein